MLFSLNNEFTLTVKGFANSAYIKAIIIKKTLPY